MSAPLVDAARCYVGRGWPLFAVGPDKRPLTAHGRTDATLDLPQIHEWCRRWPHALLAVATGEAAGIVALDIDVTDKLDGWDSAAELGMVFAPETPIAHTPRGGSHLIFAHPGAGIFVKTIAGKIGPALDVRGDGGSLTLPPGPGRYWDPHLGLDTPLAPMPVWMLSPEPKPIDVGSRPMAKQRLSRYGEAALDGAVKRIITAAAGAQETTLNVETFSIGRLVGGGVIPACLALNALTWAARKMPSHDARRPWREVDLVRKVKVAFADGVAEPRAPA